MKFGAIIGGIIGLGLSAWLLESYGIGRIIDLLEHAGWLGILTVIAFHGVQVLFSALGWRVISGPNVARPGLRTYLALSWICEAVNSLLPLAPVAREFLGSRLLLPSGIR